MSATQEPLNENTCHLCGDQFSRPDHLKRHLDTHKPSYVYHCKHCGKAFNRRDSLIRHERGHEENASIEGHRTIYSRVSQACANCSKSKVRCDGMSPCSHCSSRQLECTPNSKQRKRPRRNAATAESTAPVSKTTQIETYPLPTPLSGRNVSHDETEVSVMEHSLNPVESNAITHSPDLSTVESHAPLDPTEVSFTMPQEWDFQFNIADWMTWGPNDLLHLANASFAPGTENPPAVATNMQNKMSPFAAEPPLYSMGNDLPRPIGTVRLETASPYFQNTANEVLNSHSACSVDHDANTSSACSPQGTQTGLLGARKTFAVFPEFDAANIEILHAENYGHTAPTSTSVYNAVLRGVQEICVLGGFSDSLKVSLFPSHKIFDAFIQLYFEYFEGLFPIIHKATFNPDDSHWIELLALATVGCRYSKSAVARKCTEAMSEVFRLSIFHTIEVDRLSVRSLWLTRAMVLDVVGTLYSGDKRLMEVGLTILNAVTMQCRHNRYLEASTSNFMTWNVQDEQALHNLWVKWSYEEACRRIACSTWILQCQLGLNFDIPSYMRINELMQPLPYPEDVWEAPDAKTWYSRCSSYAVGSHETSLGSALAAVMRRELIPAAVGGFGRLAMVHAIYHTTFDLRTTLSNPLTVGLLGDSSSEAIALRNWQSRAVELLELLTPLEAPKTTGNIVLMHHSASLTLHSNFITTIHHVLLLSFTPIGDLFLFVSPRSDASEESRARENLLAWICHREGRDARRAVLSACAIFSIIRLRPSQSFHESIPFLMATLTVWAYNHLASSVFDEVTNPPPGHAVTLRLDQVSRAEEAKLWIEKEPGTVRGYLSEVGDIHDHIAGKRLLSVAYQALSTMNTWGLSHGFSNFLKTLLESNYS